MNRSKKKHTVHFRCEVRYTVGSFSAALVPGQAFPIRFDLKRNNHDKLGEVEIRTYAALFLGDDVYTDIATHPLSKVYIEDEDLSRSIYTHTTHYGYGITVLKTQPHHPGIFDSDGRTTVPYSIVDLLEHESKGRYMIGPASYIRQIPGIYAKLTDKAPASDHDELLWDAETEKVCRFRRLPIPVVLGEFDVFKHQQPWQKELMAQAFSPFRDKVPLLHTLLESATENGVYGIFETCGYWYGYPAPVPHEGLVNINDMPIYIALLPKVPHDALAGIDKGRNRISSWRNMFYKQYGS